jgi:hypothetical protein
MRCCICGGPVSGTFWVCRACKDQWGLGTSLAEWPEWARSLQAAEERRRKQAKWEAANQWAAISDETDGSDEITGSPGDGYSEQKRTRYPTYTDDTSKSAPYLYARRKWYRTRPGIDYYTGLPIAPYDDDVSNRQYQKANGIRPRQPPRYSALPLPGSLRHIGPFSDLDRLARLDIETAIRRLTPKQQEALLLYLQGYSESEIAAQLGIRQQSVNERIEAAVATIRKYVSLSPC